MIELILFLSIGVGLLLLLFILARRPAAVEGSAQGLVETRSALRSLQHALLPAEFVERIFAKQDLQYVVSTAPPEIRDIFLRDRKRIALAWIGQVRRHILSLREYHFRRSRFYSRLSVQNEITLALDFMALLLQCRLLQILLFLAGPNQAPWMAGRTAAAAARICTVSEKSLAFLTPPRVAGLRHQSPEDGGAVL